MKFNPSNTGAATVIRYSHKISLVEYQAMPFKTVVSVLKDSGIDFDKCTCVFIKEEKAWLFYQDVSLSELPAVADVPNNDFDVKLTLDSKQIAALSDWQYEQLLKDAGLVPGEMIVRHNPETGKTDFGSPKAQPQVWQFEEDKTWTKTWSNSDTIEYHYHDDHISSWYYAHNPIAPSTTKTTVGSLEHKFSFAPDYVSPGYDVTLADPVMSTHVLTVPSHYTAKQVQRLKDMLAKGEIRLDEPDGSRVFPEPGTTKRKILV